MLIKVKKLDYSNTSYAPTVVDAVLNTDDVVMAQVIPAQESRRPEPCCCVWLDDDTAFDVLGTPDQFLRGEDMSGEDQAADLHHIQLERDQALARANEMDRAYQTEVDCRRIQDSRYAELERRLTRQTVAMTQLATNVSVLRDACEKAENYLHGQIPTNPFAPPDVRSLALARELREALAHTGEASTHASQIERDYQEEEVANLQRRLTIVQRCLNAKTDLLTDCGTKVTVLRRACQLAMDYLDGDVSEPPTTLYPALRVALDATA